VWGTFDLENFGDVVFPLIARRELSERLPQSTIRTFSPYGYRHPIRWDGGEPAEPFGSWSPDRAAELAGQLDCVLVGGGEIIHTHDELLAPHYGVNPSEVGTIAPSRFFIEGLGPELERACPVIWNAVGVPFDPAPEEAGRLRAALASRPYVAVRDETSKARLEAAGVDREIAVVPDSGFLLPRLFPPEVLAKRLEFLRLMEWYPREEPALVVQGNRSLVELAPGIARAVSRVREELDASIVTVETGPCHGDGEFADALRGALPGRVYRLPTEAGVEDLVAAIASSAGFIGISFHGNVMAFVSGRPSVMLNPNGQSKLDGLARMIGNTDAVVEKADDIPKAFEYVSSLGPQPALVAALQERVDRHLDRIAEIAEGAAEARGASGERSKRDRIEELEERLLLLERAHEGRGRRLARERLAFADRVEGLRAEQEEDRRARWEEVVGLHEEIRQHQETISWLRAVVGEREEEAAGLKEELTRREEELEGTKRSLEDLLSTRTFRYTASIRNLYGRLRRLFRR
jgi:lipopolysaccharide transport system ATP-binding protein